MSSVRILFFSVLREKIRRDSLEFDIDGSLSADELLDRLTAAYPVLSPYRGSLRVAVNEAYVDGGHVVSGGDEVALITPVSGG